MEVRRPQLDSLVDKVEIVDGLPSSCEDNCFVEIVTPVPEAMVYIKEILTWRHGRVRRSVLEPNGNGSVLESIVAMSGVSSHQCETCSSTRTPLVKANKKA
jgi:hypothetical protein